MSNRGGMMEDKDKSRNNIFRKIFRKSNRKSDTIKESTSSESLSDLNKNSSKSNN